MTQQYIQLNTRVPSSIDKSLSQNHHRIRGRPRRHELSHVT